MNPRTGYRPTQRRLGVAAVFAVLLVGVVPGSAGAVGELIGGATPGTAVVLPADVVDLDGALRVTNTGVPGGTGARNPAVAPYWNNVAWYAFSPSVTGTVAIWTDSDSVWLPSLEVWTEAGVLLQQNTNAIGYEGAVVINVTAGQRYSIGVGGGGYTYRGTAALRFAPGNPVAPIVTVTPGDGSVALSWEQPPGTPAAMAYRVIRGGLYAGFTGEDPFVTTATAKTITGLTNGQTYTFSVEARNPFGALVSSAPVAVTPRAPSAVTATTTPADPVSGEPFTVTASVSSNAVPVAGGSVAISVDGGPSTGVPISGGVVGPLTVGPLAAGPHTLVVEYPGTSSIAPSTLTQTITVAKRTQTVDFMTVDPAFRIYEHAIVLHATSSRGLPVTFTTNGTGICSVRDGNTLDLVGVGTCVVTATQVGDTETEPAEVSQSFEVDKRSQTVSLEPLDPMVYGQDGVRVVADSPLGLPVTVEATGDCEMVGDLVLTTGAGSCTVTVTQPGDAHHHAAPPVSQTFLVAKRAQTLTLSDLPALAQGVRQMPFRAESSVGLPVTVTASGACGYADGVVSTSAIGLCTVTVEAAGDDDTEPVTATRSVTVVNAAAEVFVYITGRAGDLVPSVPFVAEGTQLLPGSTMTVTAYSDPILVGTATVTASGTGRVATTLPTLSPGTHRLVVAGVGMDGATVQSEVSFAVSAVGAITWIGTAPAARGSGSSLAATGADNLGATGLIAALWIVTGAGLLLVRRAVVRRRRVAVI
jgi:hypothetical protein